MRSEHPLDAKIHDVVRLVEALLDGLARAVPDVQRLEPPVDVSSVPESCAHALAARESLCRIIERDKPLPVRQHVPRPIVCHSLAIQWELHLQPVAEAHHRVGVAPIAVEQVPLFDSYEVAHDKTTPG